MIKCFFIDEGRYRCSELVLFGCTQLYSFVLHYKSYLPEECDFNH